MNITVVVLDIRGRGVQVVLADGDGDAFWLPRLRPAEWSHPPEIGEAVNVYVPDWLARKHKPLVALRQSTQKHLALHMAGVDNIEGSLPMADYPADVGKGFLGRDKNHQPGSKRPEYSGKINVRGEDLRIVGWLRTSEKTNEKYFSLAISEIEQQRSPEPPQRSEPPREQGSDWRRDSEIPF